MRSRSPIIIFLDRLGFLLCQLDSDNVWQFPFERNAVSDMEVIDKDSLINSIWSLIQSNKIIPGNIIIILSDSVVFQKKLTPFQKSAEHQDKAFQEIYTSREMQEQEIQKFIENVPFEEVLAKVIGDTRIVATSKELLETIVWPFKKLGCFLDAVVPSFIYDQKVDFSLGLNQGAAKAILRETDLLRFGNMLTNQQSIVQQPEESPYISANDPTNETNNYRQFILLAIFIFLLGVLAIVYFVLGRTPSAPKVLEVSNSANLEKANAPTPTVIIAENEQKAKIVSESLPDDLKNARISIVTQNGAEVIANALKNILTQANFLDVVIEFSDDSIPAKSSILFSQNVPLPTRAIAIGEVKKIFPDIIVGENQNEDQNITIIIGKSL